MTDIISQNLSKKEAVATTTCWKMEMDVIFCKDLAFKISIKKVSLAPVCIRFMNLGQNIIENDKIGQKSSICIFS